MKKFTMKGTSAAVVTLTVLAGAARGQVGTGVYVSGFLHSPIGGATFDPPVERRLPVRNLGSSGEDGVEVQLRSSQGGAVDIDVSGLFVAGASGGEIKIKHKGWDGLIYHRYRAQGNFSDGTNADLTEECDFSTLGPVHVEVTCTSSTGVETVLIRESPTLLYTSSNPINPGSPPVWTSVSGNHIPQAILSVRRSAAATLRFPSTTGGLDVVPDVITTSFRPICIVAPCPGDNTNLGSMVITSNLPQLDVSNAMIKIEPCAGCPNGPTDDTGVYGVGLAEVSEVMEDITGDGVPDTVYRTRCPNIGSSGQDGVEINWPPVTLSAREKVYNGHVTLMKAFDDDTGAEARMIVEKDPVTGDMSLTPDYTLMGSTQTLVTAYDDNDNPVGSFILGVAGVATIHYSVLCPPGSYPTFVTIGYKKYFTGCQYYFDLVAPGGGTIPNVHSVSFEALGATTAFNSVTRTGHYTNDGEDIILGDLLATIGTTGPACDSIDFNNDGLFPDSTDIDDFLSVFSGGVCSNDPFCGDIDFNNDGLFPDSTDIDSLLSVFSGGACL